MNISKLFTRYGSDKACGVLGDPSSGHWFGEKYDEIFNSLDPKIAYNILEIGIQKAGCMKAIREILP